MMRHRVDRSLVGAYDQSVNIVRANSYYGYYYPIPGRGSLCARRVM
jgi:hypothetical protein